MNVAIIFLEIKSVAEEILRRYNLTGNVRNTPKGGNITINEIIIQDITIVLDELSQTLTTFLAPKHCVVFNQQQK